MGGKFTVFAGDFAENLDKAQYTASEYVQETGRRKAMDVREKLMAKGMLCSAAPLEKAAIVIGADTIVVRNYMQKDEQIMEKPADATLAMAMLKSLSGKSHHVITGVTLLRCNAQTGEVEKTITFASVTAVEFSELPHEIIEAYVATSESFLSSGFKVFFSSFFVVCFFNEFLVLSHTHSLTHILSLTHTLSLFITSSLTHRRTSGQGRWLWHSGYSWLIRVFHHRRLL